MYASRGSVAASKQHVSHVQEEVQLKLYHEAVDEIVQRGCGMCGGRLLSSPSRQIRLVDVQSSVDVQFPSMR